MCGWAAPGRTPGQPGKAPLAQSQAGQAQGPRMPGPDGAPVCPTPPSQRWTRAEHAHPRAKGVEKNIAHRVWVPDLGHSSHWTTQTGRRASERVPIGTRSWTVTCLPVTPEKPGDGAGGTGERRQMQAGLLASAQPVQKAGPGARRAAAQGPLSLGHRRGPVARWPWGSSPIQPTAPAPAPSPAPPCRSERLLPGAGGRGWRTGMGLDFGWLWVQTLAATGPSSFGSL